MRQYILVSYDISDQKRWRKVFKIMKGYGEHVQYSVFICQLSDVDEVQLKTKLDEVVNHNQDQIMFVRIGPVTGKQLDNSVKRHIHPDRLFLFTSVHFPPNIE